MYNGGEEKEDDDGEEQQQAKYTETSARYLWLQVTEVWGVTAPIARSTALLVRPPAIGSFRNPPAFGDQVPYPRLRYSIPSAVLRPARLKTLTVEHQYMENN